MDIKSIEHGAQKLIDILNETESSSFNAIGALSMVTTEIFLKIRLTPPQAEELLVSFISNYKRVYKVLSSKEIALENIEDKKLKD